MCLRMFGIIIKLFVHLRLKKYSEGIYIQIYIYKSVFQKIF